MGDGPPQVRPLTVVVTGGGGFLGAAIVRALVDRGDVVRTFGRGSYPELAAAGADVVRGDIRDAEAVRSVVAGAGAVIHTAAKVELTGDPVEFRAVNVDGTRHVIDACRRGAVGKLVYTSTPSVAHHGGDVSGIDETAGYAESFASPYPQTKAEAEQDVLAAADGDLGTVALRPHLIWGPGDRHLVPEIVRRARQGRAFLIGDGTNRIDTTFIDNAVHAHLAALDRVGPGTAVSGRAYFIAQGEPMPIRDVLSALLGAAGLPPIRRSVPHGVAKLGAAVTEGAFRFLPGVPPITRFLVEQLATEHWYDLSAAARDLEYRPVVRFADGVERLRAWYSDVDDGG